MRKCRQRQGSHSVDSSGRQYPLFIPVQYSYSTCLTFGTRARSRARGRRQWRRRQRSQWWRGGGGPRVATRDAQAAALPAHPSALRERHLGGLHRGRHTAHVRTASPHGTRACFRTAALNSRLSSLSCGLQLKNLGAHDDYNILLWRAKQYDSRNI